MSLRTDISTMNCSLARALHQVGDAWSMLLLRECALGMERFEDFVAALGAARQVVTNRLASLVEYGLLERLPRVSAQVSGTPAKRASYRLTEKGRALLPALVALMQWGDVWVSGAGREPVIPVGPGGAAVAPMALRTRAGRVIDPADLFWGPGPGSDARTREHIRRAPRSARSSGG
jgi:DNA-binding HxlR family transcriptional regulator